MKSEKRKMQDVSDGVRNSRKSRIPRPSTVVTLALILFLAAGAAAGEELSIPYEKHVLANGLTVILHEDHGLPRVAVNLRYFVGSRNEKPGMTGFAHLFEHLMFNGSEHHPGEYFEPLEKIGAKVNGNTSSDRTEYFEEVPSMHLGIAFWLESDRMGFLLPAVDQKKLDNQRDVVKNERRQRYENRPYGMVWEWIPAAVFPADHPYHWPTIGSMADIDAASLEMVHAFFKRYYLPGNASLVVAGDIDPVRCLEMARRYFEPIPAGPPVPPVKAEPPVLEKLTRLRKTDRIKLSRLYMVWVTPPLFAPGDAELDILSAVLSEGKSSRLYRSLVYEQQIAKDVSAFQASEGLSSLYFIVATAGPGHSLDELEKEIDRVLTGLREKPPTDREVQRAKNGWEARFVRSLQGILRKASLLNTYFDYTGDPGYLHRDMERYRKVTPASVQEVVRSQLRPDARLILEVHPKNSE